MSLLISGATIIDGVSERPLEGYSIWIEGRRIRAVGPRGEVGHPPGARVVDAAGKYIIPGLMDANVHLMGDVRLENIVRYEGRYEDLIIEAAQIALKSGLTTVFDTWGPRQPLISAREKISSGEVPGSRIFCAGNIIGLDGVISRDFNARALEVASGALLERINGIWTSNVGPALSWMTPEQVAHEVHTYIGRGIDFVKYASSEHRWGDPTTFLVFSPQSQAAIVREAHQAGMTAQAHATSVESLRVAVEAGCDIIQHCNISGPVPIPEATLELIVERGTGAVVFPFTERRFKWIMEKCAIDPLYFSTSDTNCRNLARSGARILLATDAFVVAHEFRSDPVLTQYWSSPGEDNLAEFGQGHFHWLKAMEEKGFPAMEILRAATRNIAVAYQKDQDLGTLEAGKLADLLILNEDPLESAENYRSIETIVKDGIVVDRALLPLHPVLTVSPVEPTEEALAYRAHRHFGNSRQPCCV